MLNFAGSLVFYTNYLSFIFLISLAPLIWGISSHLSLFLAILCSISIVVSLWNLRSFGFPKSPAIVSLLSYPKVIILGPWFWLLAPTDNPLAGGYCFAFADCLTSSTLWPGRAPVLGMLDMTAGFSFITCFGSLHMKHLSSDSTPSSTSFLNLHILHLHSPFFVSTPPPIRVPLPCIACLVSSMCVALIGP